MTEAPVVLISGGSRGLGLALVDMFLERGWRVATFARGASPSIEARACDSLFWQALDSTDDAALAALPKAVVRRWGRLDALVNNAGVGFDGLLTFMRTEEIDRVLDVNLRATILLTQAAGKAMIRAGRGSVVNVSSVNAVRGHSGVSVYSATKAALDGLTRSLARELGPRSIRVNSVAPGYFASEMVADLSEEATARITRRTPLGRLAEPSEIAEAVYFLASEKSAFITGQTLAVDGGITC